MALPTGQISFADINTELGRSANAQISLNDSNVRSLVDITTGQISLGDLRGKSAFTKTHTLTCARSGSTYGFANGTSARFGAFSPDTIDGYRIAFFNYDTSLDSFIIWFSEIGRALPIQDVRYRITSDDGTVIVGTGNSSLSFFWYNTIVIDESYGSDPLNFVGRVGEKIDLEIVRI